MKTYEVELNHRNGNWVQRVEATDYLDAGERVEKRFREVYDEVAGTPYLGGLDYTVKEVQND